MNTNWKAGDKAVCVQIFEGVGNASREPMPGDNPQLGNTYLVSGVNYHLHGLGLFLAGMRACTHRPEVDFVAYKFRKVVTATERAAQEKESLIPHEGFWQGRPDL